MHNFRRFLHKADGIIYRGERALLLFSVVMMTVLVFLDVVQRTFSRPVGKTSKILAWVLKIGADVSAETQKALETTWGPLLFWFLFGLFLISATHTARTLYAKRRLEASGKGTDGLSVAFLPGLVLGIFITACMYGGIQLLLWAAPSGIAGAQKFALGFLVWSGFLGASLATRSNRHIVLDAVKKKVDTDTRIWFSAIGGLLVGVFCSLIGYLGAKKTITEIIEWRESGGVIHVFETLPIPVWTVSMAIPIFFFLIGLRSVAHGFGDLLYGESLAEQPDALGIDFKALEEEALRSDEEVKEMDAPGDLGTPKVHLYGKPSSDAPMLIAGWE